MIVLTDLLQIKKKNKSVTYLRSTDQLGVGPKMASNLFTHMKLLTQKMRRKVLYEITKYAGMFRGLNIANGYDDIIDTNIVDWIWTAIGSSNNNGRMYSLKGLVNGECASGDFDFKNGGLKIFCLRWPKKQTEATSFGGLLLMMNGNPRWNYY